MCSPAQKGKALQLCLLKLSQEQSTKKAWKEPNRDGCTLTLPVSSDLECIPKSSRASENCYCLSFHLPSWPPCTTSVPHCSSVLEDPASWLCRSSSKLFPGLRSPVLHTSLCYFTQLSSAPLSDLSSKVNSPGKSASDPIPNILPVQFSCSVMSDSLRPHELQHTRPPCPSRTPGVHSDLRPSSLWCHPPSHPLLSPSPSARNPSQHHSLFQWVNSSHEVAKVLEFQL